MSKIIIAIFLLFICIFIPKSSYAFPLIGEVKVWDCGVAGGPRGMDKCCSDSATSLSAINAIRTIVSQFPNVPLIGDINNLFNDAADLQNQYGKTNKCVVGVEINSASGCICGYSNTTKSPKKMETLCRQYIVGSTISDRSALNNCLRCTQKGNGNEFFWSAFGCMPLDIKSFINNYVYIYGIGLAGTIMFLCILLNAYRIQFSQGKPETVKKAVDSLKSCLFGLLVILGAVLIVRIIGIDIIQIPGLGS